MYNASNGTKERVSRLVKMHANKREEIEAVQAGDIAAVVGIKDAILVILCADEEHLIFLESIDVPAPVISASS